MKEENIFIGMIVIVAIIVISYFGILLNSPIPTIKTPSNHIKQKISTSLETKRHIEDDITPHVKVFDKDIPEIIIFTILAEKIHGTKEISDFKKKLIKNYDIDKNRVKNIESMMF